MSFLGAVKFILWLACLGCIGGGCYYLVFWHDMVVLPVLGALALIFGATLAIYRKQLF
ncbi:hypothetical protein FACS1894186_8020 [Alphaproteobacteria bacterium]|nr:hypothetical protein FACS1894186_8020 [Alphaproteobacteria bacterium]